MKITLNIFYQFLFHYLSCRLLSFQPETTSEVPYLPGKPYLRGNKRSARIRNQQQNTIGEQDNTELDEEDDDDCGVDCDEHQ